MKKYISILTLIFGFTQLTASDSPYAVNDPNNPFYAHIRKFMPTQAAQIQEIQAISTSLPVPSKGSEYFSESAYGLGKAALKISSLAATALVGYRMYHYYYSAAPVAIHRPFIEIDAPITHLELTIEVQKNGWLKPLTLKINPATEPDNYRAFQEFLQRNLTDAEKATTSQNGNANVELLQKNETYTFAISGKVTYQGAGQYDLQKETVIETPKYNDDNDNDNDKNGWIEAFWEKNIDTRITPVWQQLPSDFIDDSTATYHAVISDTATEAKLYSVDIHHKEKLKELIIKALANEISATTQKQLTIKISVTTEKNFFVNAPLTIAIDAPGQEAAILNNLQHPYTHPFFFKAAQIAYATQLWDTCCENALEKITPAPEGKKLLPTIFCTTLGVIALVKAYNWYKA